MKQTKRNKIIDILVFVILLLVVSGVMLTLFYRQTVGNVEYYDSDMPAYILEMQGLDSGYDFPYPVFFKLSALIHLFTGPEMAVAIATMLLNSLGIVLTKWAFHRLIPCKNWLTGVVYSVAAIALFFISMLFAPEGMALPGIRYKYLGVFTPNPFHNATYMAARPFAILAFLWFVKLLPVYETGLKKEASSEGANITDYIGFSAFLLVATMTKPSFTLVLVSTAGLIMLWRLIRSGFRNFVPTIQLGLCFIPTFVDLLYQFGGVFVPDDGAEGGIGINCGWVWRQYCDNIPLAVCLAVGFPLVVLACNWKECKKSTLFLFSWQFYLMSFAEAFLLYEKGFRRDHFNFSWGYICGIFFCHFAAMVVLLGTTLQEFSRAKKADVATGQSLGNGRNGTTGGLQRGSVRIVFIALQWLMFLWHLACGLYYFSILFAGRSYW